MFPFMAPGCLPSPHPLHRLWPSGEFLTCFAALSRVTAAFVELHGGLRRSLIMMDSLPVFVRAIALNAG
jgi:hypothetical protein